MRTQRAGLVLEDTDGVFPRGLGTWTYLNTPPERQTRTGSAAARPGSGANITPKVDRTTSKASVGNGSAMASPTTNRAVSVSPASHPG